MDAKFYVVKADAIEEETMVLQEKEFVFFTLSEAMNFIRKIINQRRFDKHTYIGKPVLEEV